ncbi:MAG: response regulator [Verrucomicrobiota bacterium]|nr:response regulator [Verrucomicrobiota bacterium]
MKVIVADDDPISREILSTLLTKWGYQTLITRDGREAMEALRAQTSPAIALLDWMMPGIDGIEVCQRVREAGKPVYILLLTSRSGKEQVVEGLNAGADDYLIKPFDPDELQARIRVGVRILELQVTLSARVTQLEALALENHQLKLQIPL